jgi:hypothetical protein
MRYLIVLIFLFQSLMSLAQDRYVYVNLDINTPLSNRSWVGSTSSSGIRAGIRSFINDKFSVGLDLGMANYDDYLPTATYQTGTKTITTDYFKYVYSFSAVASGQYNFRVGNGEKLFPYAGIGVGAENNEYVRYYNVYKDTDTSWGFLARPEAGILFKFTRYRSLGAMAAVHYDFATNRSNVFNYNNFSNIGFQIGVVFLQM